MGLVRQFHVKTLRGVLPPIGHLPRRFHQGLYHHLHEDIEVFSVSEEGRGKAAVLSNHLPYHVLFLPPPLWMTEQLT